MTDTAAERYLDLLKGCLTRDLFLDEEVRNVDLRLWPTGDPDTLRELLREHRWRLVEPTDAAERRVDGNDWPPHAETMVGRARLDSLQNLIERALEAEVPGDLVEAGVWRGGTVALMRAVLSARGDTDRVVWACDSFEGLPEPDDERFPQDVAMQFHTYPQLAVSLDQVKKNLARYDLLDERVVFLEGWFRDTLPEAPIGEIAVLRLDGDMYESTIDVLPNLEPKVSAGGYVIIDDYGGIEACREAVTDYRREAGIHASIQQVDWTGAWWQKEHETNGSTQVQER